jgi:YbbR domain-containing protein
VEPESVLVTGPERFVAALDTLTTEALDLSRLESSTRLQRNVKIPLPHLVVAPDQVDVDVAIARVESRTLPNIAVVALVDAGQLEVGISPPIADLMVRGPADSVRALVPARVSVTLPVGDLPEGIHRLRGDVTVPDWTTLVAIEPEFFTVIVGKPDASEDGDGDR